MTEIRPMKMIMLGKTVPEPTSERVTHYVCCAGYSPDDGLVRIYPIRLQNTPPRWRECRIMVTRQPSGDSRHETWRPVDVQPGQSLDWPDEMPRAQRWPALREFVVSGIVEANEQRFSLAVVRPLEPSLRLEANDIDGEPSYRLYEGNRALKGRERFEYTPRLYFKTEDGREHRLQVRDWGIWELMRKNPTRLTLNDRDEWVGAALRLNPSSALLIGNFCNHRTSWLVISVLNIRP